MVKFRIRTSINQYLTVHELNKLVNPYEESDEEFLKGVHGLLNKAVLTKSIQDFGGGGLLDLYALPNGVLLIVTTIMGLDYVEGEEVK